MSHANFYGPDFGFDSSNSSTLTLKFDECEAITESSQLTPVPDGYTLADTSSSSGGGGGSGMGLMDSLKDNPVLTTASMPIPTRNVNASGGTNNPGGGCRLPLDFGLDFDLSQDLNMPQMLLMDGTDLNDDSSPTLFGGHGQYGGADSLIVSGDGRASVDMVPMRNDFSSHVNVTPTNQSQESLAQLNQQQMQSVQQNLIATTTGGHQMWGSDATNSSASINVYLAKPEPLHLDDDAIFQVDKADLIQGTHFNDDPLLDISIDDISLLDDNHSLQQLHTVVSPGDSCNISPSGYAAVPHSNYYQQHSHHHNYNQQAHLHQSSTASTQQQQQLMQANQLLVHSPPESVSLYETMSSLNRSPYHLSSSTIVSPPSGGAHYQSLGGVAASSSPRARPISMSQASPSQISQIRKYKTNAANQHTKRSALHDLLRKDATGEAPLLGQSVPGGSGFGMSSQVQGQSQAALLAQRRRLAQYHHMQNSRLSSSAPTQLGMDQLWQRREPRPHLLSTSSVAAESTSSLSTGGVLSPEAPDFSQDETYSDDSDHYDDFSSGDEDVDGDSDDEQKLSKSLGSGSGRKMSKSERYFWQYNVQAKGPKGQRLVIKTEMEDPHVLNEVTDPVFSPNCSVRGIKHSGKARKGDGNDLTPNPRKLNAIGRELDKLFRVINDITPVSELPFNARTKTRKEKNKLASRACRLKKKAQHEANKIKLYGLEVEHKRLISGIEELKVIITTLSNNGAGGVGGGDGQEEIAQRIDRIYQSASKLKIGGMSTEYVNQMIQKVKGTDRGGLMDN